MQKKFNGSLQSAEAPMEPSHLTKKKKFPRSMNRSARVVEPVWRLAPHQQQQPIISPMNKFLLKSKGF